MGAAIALLPKQTAIGIRLRLDCCLGVGNWKMLCKIFSIFLLLGAANAGFRCTFGNWACTAGCVGLGQTSGLCDDAGVCHCSAKSISLSNFHAMLPSRCTLGESFCQGTCHSLGRATGTCGTYGCTCSDRFLTPSEFLLCAAESTCRLDCQAKGHATGQCEGWACNCS